MVERHPVIVFEGVSKTYPEEKIPAVHDVSFSVEEGEFLCMIGPSGCGKSTVLKLIAGLTGQSKGAIKKPSSVAMSFQSGALFPWLTAFENVAFGLKNRGIRGDALRRDVEVELAQMKMLGLKNKYPSELSGGERQRVGIARALAVHPKILLLDEPFSALDAKTTAELHDDIIEIWRHTKKTIVMVSHLIDEAVSLANRVILMRKGTIDAIFQINLPYPRREQGAGFLHQVEVIREEFFK